MITLRSKGAEVTLLVAYALATVPWVIKSKAETKGDQQAKNNTGTRNRRNGKAMGLDY